VSAEKVSRPRVHEAHVGASGAAGSSRQWLGVGAGGPGRHSEHRGDGYSGRQSGARSSKADVRDDSFLIVAVSAALRWRPGRSGVGRSPCAMSPAVIAVFDPALPVVMGALLQVVI